ncbi:MAG: hypothetical protein KDA61_09965 [Planctomycetales bacterium]|nr:hypothetical protein [Planctomycetales bacterium]
MSSNCAHRAALRLEAKATEVAWPDAATLAPVKFEEPVEFDGPVEPDDGWESETLTALSPW